VRHDVALEHLFRVEPGATLERALERVAGASRSDLQADIESLLRLGRIEQLGDGYRTVPQPDPLDVARAALESVVGEPDPEKMTEIAQTALDDLADGGRAPRRPARG